MTQAGWVTPYIGSMDQSASSSRSGGYPPIPPVFSTAGEWVLGQRVLKARAGWTRHIQNVGGLLDSRFTGQCE